MKYSPRITVFKNIIKEKLTVKNIIRAAAIVVAIIAFIVLLSVINSPKASNTSFYGEEVIYVGLASDSTLAEKTKDGFSGFEKDVVEQLLKNIYGEEKRVEFKEITSQNASYLLKNGDIDLALGMFASGVTKTRGTLLTNAYYYDNNLIIVRANSGFGEIKDLTGKNIGIMSTELKASDIKSKLADKGVSDTSGAKGYTSYPDAVDALKAGRVDAIVAGEQKLKQYVSEGIKELGTAGTTGYCIMAWTDETEFVLVANEELSKMSKNGTFKTLREKWDLGS